MPRMSKQRRLEWSFFLDHRNRISFNPPLPWLHPRLQAELPGNRCSLPALLVKTLETARLRAVTIRYAPFPAKEVTFHH